MSTQSTISRTVGFVAGAVATMILVMMLAAGADAVFPGRIDPATSEVVFYFSILLAPFGGLLGVWLDSRKTKKDV